MEKMVKVQCEPESSQRIGGNFIRIVLASAILSAQIALIFGFFYYDRQGSLSMSLRSWGAKGVVTSILLMAIFDIFPVPSEFLLVVNMKVFGVGAGILYSWLGAMIGSLMIFIVARYIGSPILYDFVSQKYLRKVDTWVQHKGITGLLLVRLLPIPAPFLNYAAGLLKSIRLWDYLWTMALSIWPYYMGAACLFVGVPNKAFYWIACGFLLLLFLWLLGMKLNCKTE